MNPVRSGWIVIGLLVPLMWAASGCTKDYCEDSGETAIEETGETGYEAARRRAPDNGWRVRIEE